MNSQTKHGQVTLLAQASIELVEEEHSNCFIVHSLPVRRTIISKLVVGQASNHKDDFLCPVPVGEVILRDQHSPSLQCRHHSFHYRAVRCYPCIIHFFNSNFLRCWLRF